MGGSPAKWAIVAGYVLVPAVFAAVVFVFDPGQSQYSFYPPCLFHKLTGLDCPGCGSTRALHQLLHGHIAAAFRLNALLVFLLPVLGYCLVSEIVRTLRGRGLPSPSLPTPWIWGLVVVLLAFTVWRNLP